MTWPELSGFPPVRRSQWSRISRNPESIGRTLHVPQIEGHLSV